MLRFLAACASRETVVQPREKTSNMSGMGTRVIRKTSTKRETRGERERGTRKFSLIWALFSSEN